MILIMSKSFCLYMEHIHITKNNSTNTKFCDIDLYLHCEKDYTSHVEDRRFLHWFVTMHNVLKGNTIVYMVKAGGESRNHFCRLSCRLSAWILHLLFKSIPTLAYNFKCTPNIYGQFANVSRNLVYEVEAAETKNPKVETSI